jgi:anthranilate phosphoribosyltransferase
MKELIKYLQEGTELSGNQVQEAATDLLDESIKISTKADFLEALSKKGETPAEIAAFVEEFLKHAVVPELKYVRKPIIDVCGTGGDQLGMFNVSTASVFVLAAAGCAVVKHGNRAITSKCGGADVLEALDINIEMPPAELVECIKSVGAGFLYAPNYHTAFAAVAPVRKLLAKRGSHSIFNLLGPLLNPVKPKFQLVGINNPKLGADYAKILALLGRERAWVCHGISEKDHLGMDEFCAVGSTMVWPTGKSKFEVDASVLGIRGGTIADLKGGTAKQNAKIIQEILSGADLGPKRDMVALNASAGLVVAGVATDIRNGLEIAREVLSNGKAMTVLDEWKSFR